MLKSQKALLLGIVIAILTSIISGLVVNHQENIRARTYRISFSEVEYFDDTPNLNKLNLYLPLLNDTVMKVFECSNTAAKPISEGYSSKSFGSYESLFSYELEKRLDPSLKVYKYELSNLLGEEGILAKLASEGDADLYKVYLMYKEAYTARSRAGGVWTESHNDVYHHETRVTTSTDMNGKVTFGTETVSVYDYTDHTYTYNSNHARLALEAGDILIKSNFPENLLRWEVAKDIHSENDMAIQKSREEEKLNDSSRRTLSFNWLMGSGVQMLANECNANTNYIPTALAVFRISTKNSKSVTYRNTTLGCNEPGPNEYQIAMSYNTRLACLTDTLGRLNNVIPSSYNKVAQLDSKIKMLVSTKENKNQLTKEVLALATEIYKDTFANGYEVTKYRSGRVLCWTLIMLVVGFGAGLGIGYWKFTDSYDTY